MKCEDFMSHAFQEIASFCNEWDKDDHLPDRRRERRIHSLVHETLTRLSADQELLLHSSILFAQLDEQRSELYQKESNNEERTAADALDLVRSKIASLMLLAIVCFSGSRNAPNLLMSRRCLKAAQRSLLAALNQYRLGELFVLSQTTDLADIDRRTLLAEMKDASKRADSLEVKAVALAHKAGAIYRP